MRTRGKKNEKKINKIRVYFPELGGGVRPNLENTQIFFNEPFPKVLYFFVCSKFRENIKKYKLMRLLD